MEFWTVVVATVAIVVSVISSVYTFRQSRHLAGSGFKAAEDLKVDLVALLSALRSIVYKGIATSQDLEPRDIRLELEQVRTFQASPSGYALAALAAERGSGDDSDSGQWRVLGLQFAYLGGIVESPTSEASTALVARKWATEIETTLGGLTLKDVNWMARKVSDLPEMIGSLRQTRSQDMVLHLWFELSARRRAEDNPEDDLATLRSIKSNGVNDPDVDLWIAMLTDDSDALQDALNAGASQAVTKEEVLERYREHAAGPEAMQSP